MNQITPELFEPQLKAFAKAVCEETFPPFVMSQCTRRGDIILQDKKNNAGKHGYCKFHITLIKEKKNGKLKDRGSADIIVKGIYNVNPDGSLS